MGDGLSVIIYKSHHQLDYFTTSDVMGLTLTTGLVPAKTASTLPHQRSLHQLKPHPPVASSSVVVGVTVAASAF